MTAYPEHKPSTLVTAESVGAQKKKAQTSTLKEVASSGEDFPHTHLGAVGIARNQVLEPLLEERDGHGRREEVLCFGERPSVFFVINAFLTGERRALEPFKMEE